MPNQKPVQGRLARNDALVHKSVTKLEQRSIPVLPEPSHDQIGMSFNLVGTAVATESSGAHVSMPNLQVRPTAHAGWAHAETLGNLPMRRSAINCGKHTYAKINGKGFRHICRPLSADSLNQNASDLKSNSIQSVRETL